MLGQRERRRTEVRGYGREGERNWFTERQFMEREWLGHREAERFGQSKSG